MGTISTVKSTIGYGSKPEGRPDTDFYRTPEIATEKLLEKESFTGVIWEPACGDGAISKVLIEKGYNVLSSDLYNHGYGVPNIDFTNVSNVYDWKSIITNPPYNLAREFIDKGLELTKHNDGKLALLLRLSFLEGQKRKALFETSPLKRVYVFSKRITFSRPGETRELSGMMAYAWFVWDWTHTDEPVLGWI